MTHAHKFPTLKSRTRLVLALVMLGAAPARTQNNALPMEEVLPLAQEDRNKLRAGLAVVKPLASKLTRDVGVAAVVRLNVPAEFFLRQYRDITAFKRSPQVAQIGVFGKPPDLIDLKDLTWEAADINALQKCRSGDCGMKLSNDAMQSLRRGVDWRRSDHHFAVQAAIRRFFADYVRRYMTAGNPALMRYDDKKPAVLVSSESRSILDEFPWVRSVAPEMYDYLVHYPDLPQQDVENIFYWSKENFGLKPVVSITHVAIAQKSRNGRDWTLIASKQLYANHYFEGSLGLTAVIGDGDRGCWMVYMNRSRADGLSGWLGSMKRALVMRRLESGMLKEIQRIRTRLEDAYRAGGGSN